MKITYNEFLELKKNAINCLATKFKVRYRLQNGMIIEKTQVGYYVYAKI